MDTNNNFDAYELEMILKETNPEIESEMLINMINYIESCDTSNKE